MEEDGVKDARGKTRKMPRKNMKKSAKEKKSFRNMLGEEKIRKKTKRKRIKNEKKKIR